MRRQTALPRIAREGWLPAPPPERVNKRAVVIPQPTPRPDRPPAVLEGAANQPLARRRPNEHHLRR